MKLRHKIYEIADSTGALINLENEKDVRMVYDDIVTEVLLTDAFKKVYHDEGELEGFSPLQYSSNANGTFIEDGNLVLEGKRIHLYVPEKDIHVFFTKVRNPAIAAPAVTISTQYLLGVSKLLQVIDGEALYGADLNSEEKEALNKQKEEELLAIASAPPVEALEESTPVAEYGTEITGNTEVTESGTTPEGEIPAEVTSETSQNVTGENLGGQTEVPVAGSETPVEEVTTPVAEEVTPVVEEVIPVVETPIVEEPIVEVPVVETPVAIIEEVVPVVEVPVTPQVSEVPVVQPVAEVIPEVKEEPVEEKEEVTLNAKEYQDARRFFGKRGFEEYIEGSYHFFYGDPIEEEDIYPFVLANRGKGKWEELDGSISEDTDNAVEFEFKDFADGGKVGKKYCFKLHKETGDVEVVGR